jgi:aminoglycoside phosphotransferase (APT) family kinase protein
MPGGWIRFEAGYTAAVRSVGGPAPKVLSIESVDGQEVAIFERIPGDSMWEAVYEHPQRAAEFGRLLATLHLDLLALTPPISLPARASRLACKIREAARRIEPRLSDVLDTIPRRPERLALCHGDLHPKNVILSPDGPKLVDWFDAGRGEPIGDVARVSLLLSVERGPTRAAAHLPGASPHLLTELFEAYYEQVSLRLPIREEDFAAWRVIEAAARLAEGVDEESLLQVVRDALDQGSPS